MDTNALLMTRLKRFHLILVPCGQNISDCTLPNQYCKFNNDTDATNNTNGTCEGKLTRGYIFRNKLNSILNNILLKKLINVIFYFRKDRVLQP